MIQKKKASKAKLNKLSKATERVKKDMGDIVDKTVEKLFNGKSTNNQKIVKANFLRLMFALQRDFQEKNKWIDFKNKSIRYKEERTQQMLFAIIEESIELKRELNLKEWKKKRHAVSPDQVKEELIDILHFVINIALIWKLEPEDLFSEFIDKQMTNRVRQEMGY